MTTVFGPSYADSYDILYRTKDYAAKVGLIERHLAKHGVHGSRRILDLGETRSPPTGFRNSWKPTYAGSISANGSTWR
jgi:hypothetical protein